MNKAIGIELEKLLDVCADYHDRVCTIYKKFRTEQENARKFSSDYKESERIFADLTRKAKQTAREQLQEEQENVQAEFGRYALKLEDELQAGLCKPIPAGFLRAFDVYNSSGLKPGRAELLALATLSESHPVAQRMLDELTVKTDAEYRVDHPNVADFEADISFFQGWECCSIFR
jgi:hypothetical protein